MTPEERAVKIVEMASSKGWWGIEQDIAIAIHEAVAEEMEACAKVAEDFCVEIGFGRERMALEISKEIRGRANHV